MRLIETVMKMELTEQVLDRLGQSSGFCSGEELAHSLYVSRNAVWKAVEELRRRGYQIEAVSHRGYRLAEGNTRLCAGQVRAALHSNHEILLLDRVESTNLTVKQLAEQGAPEGLIVIAREQTGGRGRRGRSFFSPTDGLYFSLLLRPTFSPQISLLATTAAAVATAQAVEEISGRECSIKWVNDILIDGRKICGILTEGSFNAETARLDYAALGIGVNLTVPQGGFPPEIADRAAAVFDGTAVPSRIKAALTAGIINRFWDFYAKMDTVSFLEEYRARSYLTGRQITYEQNGSVHYAIARDIGENMQLIIEENGVISTLGAGEVSVRPTMQSKEIKSCGTQ